MVRTRGYTKADTDGTATDSDTDNETDHDGNEENQGKLHRTPLNSYSGNGRLCGESLTEVQMLKYLAAHKAKLYGRVLSAITISYKLPRRSKADLRALIAKRACNHCRQRSVRMIQDRTVTRLPPLGISFSIQDCSTNTEMTLLCAIPAKRGKAPGILKLSRTFLRPEEQR
jgi:hypothetical protein